MKGETRPSGSEGRGGIHDSFDLKSYDYCLPEDMIAQEPVEPRDSSKLLVLDRKSGILSHRIFRDVPAYLHEKDALIINDTRVIRARLSGRKPQGVTPVEVFLLKAVAGDSAGLWEVLVRPGKRVKPGQEIILEGGVVVRIMGNNPSGSRICAFPPNLDVGEYLARYGAVPLPPYIRNHSVDPERYQTVYACRNGSVAAPTAGLHFTPSLLSEIAEKGVGIGEITLNVGLDTFRPVRTEDIREHRMHSEDFFIPEKTASLVSETKRQGGRVIAVGTTVVRALESSMTKEGVLRPGPFATDAFFYPGYRFRAVDAMVTNFHLPRSTLLILVSAFAGLELTMKAYNEAVRQGYRFFSFGDAMLIT